MFRYTFRSGNSSGAYRGKGSGKRRIPRPLLCGLAILAAVVLLLWGTAAYLQQYMVYSAEGGRLVLPGRPVPSAEVDTSPLPDLVVVEETARNG